MSSKRVPGYAASNSPRYSPIAPSRFISADQIPWKSSSAMSASSFPEPARISKRLVTGNIPSAETGPNSNTRVIAGVSCAPAGVVTLPAASAATRPSQKRWRIADRLNSGGALRGMNTPVGCTRAGPSPVAPWPIERLRPSPVANAGR